MELLEERVPFIQGQSWKFLALLFPFNPGWTGFLDLLDERLEIFRIRH